MHLPFNVQWTARSISRFWVIFRKMLMVASAISSWLFANFHSPILGIMLEQFIIIYGYKYIIIWLYDLFPNSPFSCGTYIMRQKQYLFKLFAAFLRKWSQTHSFSFSKHNLHSIGMFIWASIRLVAGGAHLPDSVDHLMWVSHHPLAIPCLGILSLKQRR